MVYRQLEIRPLLDFVQVKVFDSDGGLITFRNHRVVGQSVEGVSTEGAQWQAAQQSATSIGKALEAAAQSAGDKALDRSDAAAILVAEQRTTGSDLVIPGGLAASAQTVAAYNEGMLRDEAKIQISDILTGATLKLPADRPANREDAKSVANAKLRMGGKTAAHPGGAAASVAAAVRPDESITNP